MMTFKWFSLWRIYCCLDVMSISLDDSHWFRHEIIFSELSNIFALSTRACVHLRWLRDTDGEHYRRTTLHCPTPAPSHCTPCTHVHTVHMYSVMIDTGSSSRRWPILSRYYNGDIWYLKETLLISYYGPQGAGLSQSHWIENMEFWLF